MNSVNGVVEVRCVPRAVHGRISLPVRFLSAQKIITSLQGAVSSGNNGRLVDESDDVV